MNEQLTDREIVEREEITQRRVEYVGSAGKRTQGRLKEEGYFKEVANVAEGQVEQIHVDVQVTSPRIETFNAIDSVIKHGVFECKQTMNAQSEPVRVCQPLTGEGLWKIEISHSDQTVDKKVQMHLIRQTLVDSL